MKLTDDELSDEYKRGMEHLTQFLDKREEYRAMIKDAQSRGVQVPPDVHAGTLAKLDEFDKMIDGLEASLAKEYDRLLAEKEKDAQVTEHLNKAWDASKRIYLITKHKTPDLLEKFETQCLARLDDAQREQFLDECAILESTNLDGVLNGTA